MVWALLGELVQPAWGTQGWLGLFEIPEWSLNQNIGTGQLLMAGRTEVWDQWESLELPESFGGVPSSPGVSAGCWMCLCPLPLPSAVPGISMLKASALQAKQTPNLLVLH